jgi:predicted nucleic acid-binding protein
VIVVDSGVLIAAADTDDRHHRECARLIDERGDEFVVPAGVVIEVCWMLGRHVSVDLEADFLGSIADGELRVEPLIADDYRRASELVNSYRSLPLGAVDAMVVAIAERLAIRTVATVDHRHFSVVRPRHVRHFELVPDLGPTR